MREGRREHRAQSKGRAICDLRSAIYDLRSAMRGNWVSDDDDNEQATATTTAT